MRPEWRPPSAKPPGVATLKDMSFPLPQKGLTDRRFNPHCPADMDAAGQARHQGEGHAFSPEPALELGVHGHGVLQPLREGAQPASDVYRS